jgi:hypothetical protein
MVRRVQKEERRLHVLLYLMEVTDGTTNAYTLQRILRQVGHPVEHEPLLEEIDWFEAMGLLKAEKLPPDVVVVWITQKGRLVATGEMTVPGVSVPLGA